MGPMGPPFGGTGLNPFGQPIPLCRTKAFAERVTRIITRSGQFFPNAMVLEVETVSCQPKENGTTSPGSKGDSHQGSVPEKSRPGSPKSPTSRSGRVEHVREHRTDLHSDSCGINTKGIATRLVQGTRGEGTKGQ